MSHFSRTVFRIVLIALATILSLALVSCNIDHKISNGTMDNTIEFTDALGRIVRVKKDTKRVASLLGSFADVWCLSGGELCASADDAIEDFCIDMSDIVNIGGAHSPSLELLLSSDPDFVIASSSTASHVEMRATLEAAGIAVAYFDVDNFDDYLEMLDICTDITGRKDLYEQNGLNIKNQIETIKSQYKNENIPDRQRKILLLRVSSTSVKAKGSEGTILGEMLKDMGCINIADNDKNLIETISVESVIKQEPYHIFVVTMGSNTEAAKTLLNHMMEENPAWGTLEAVKNGRMHIMDKELFNIKPNARWAKAYEKLYEALLEQ
ncbi:MAG: ABC transporter substrate-binding protein [Eubacteriales bacterium]